MNRYQYTDANGYTLGYIEARTAVEAAEIAVARFGLQKMHCTHLSGPR